MSEMITTEFVAADYTAMDTALTSIEATIKGKTGTLTPEQRQSIGKIGDHYGTAIDEVNDALVTNPTLAPDPETFVVADFKSDRDAAKSMMLRINRMENILQQMKDTVAMHHSDLYDDLIVFYANIQVQAKNKKPGAQTIFEKLSRFFKHKKRKTIVPVKPN